MAGTCRKVLRFVSAAAFVALVAAGCGGAARPHDPAAHAVPRALARQWEARASAIADAAAAGNKCRALRFAASLRDDVIAAEPRLPARLRSPLVSSVNALADRLTCTRTVTVPSKPPKPPKGPQPPRKHHGPGPPDHHGHGGDQGNQP
jgi:hypothetical protein